MEIDSCCGDEQEKDPDWSRLEEGEYDQEGDDADSDETSSRNTVRYMLDVCLYSRLGVKHSEQ